MQQDENFEARYFSGLELYGDAFTPDQIARWYAIEEEGYFGLKGEQVDYTYDYDALNAVHAFGRLRGERFECCVGLGCAAGDDIRPLAPQVGRFVALEPAERWWRDEIGGVPATYLKPALDGGIPLPDARADLATSLGVLHHIPNVSRVLSELARVLKPGGRLVLREPISSMGDWRHPRLGLTLNERGMSPAWLEARFAALGLAVDYKAYCQFPLIARMSGQPYNSRFWTVIDGLASMLTAWNARYYRKGLRKIAPGSIFYVLRKVT